MESTTKADQTRFVVFIFECRDFLQDTSWLLNATVFKVSQSHWKIVF